MATSQLVRLTSTIVASYVGHQAIPAASIPGLIGSVYDTLSSLGKDLADEPVVQSPAVAIRKSVTPEYIICLEDGRQLKMLKRHLMSTYGMTPEEYRAKWKLPPDYPMVAPNYARKRSELAVEIGLGTHGRRRRSRTRAA